MTDTDGLKPWERDQVGKLGDGFIEIDDVLLPGVLAREIEVQYAEDVKAEWPIKVTVSFYLDELDVDEKVKRFVDFQLALTGPREVDDEQQAAE